MNNVSGWYNFDNIYREVVATAPQKAHFVEIGTWLGKSAIAMAKYIETSKKDIKFDVIDTWEMGPWAMNGQDIKEQFDTHGDLQKVCHQNFVDNKVDHLISMYKIDSSEASALYKDESLDFVFFDGDHHYEKVIQDLKLWFPKVKIDGLFGGDDYDWAGVKQAVDEIFGSKVVVAERLWLLKKI